MRIKNSFWGFITRSPEAGTLQVERIRITMLDALDTHCADAHAHMAVDQSIRFATDIEALWYLRPDLLRAIASCRDQHTATIAVRDVTMMFKGHLAVANSSRVGSL
jgi:hypothetical protein